MAEAVRYELRHWHPVLLAKNLGSRPRAVMLHGEELVLFRLGDGTVGALGNTCPHRRARLSDGWIEGDRLVCPYHGFCYAADGTGQSPGTPRMRLSAARYDVVEAWDVIWVRAHDGGEPPLPALGRPGFRHFGTLSHDVECPLEPLVDNFCEVEHTPTTHALFGYRRDALGDIEVRFESRPDEIRVTNRGPQKPIPRLVERAFGVRTGDTFIDDWVVRFSPVHIVYDQSWCAPGSDEPRGDRLHLGVFFTPIDQDETRLFTIISTDRRPTRLDALLRPFMRLLIEREVRLDRRRVETLANQSSDLSGTRLGRFDAALREHRKRIGAIYRGVRG